MWYRWKVFDFNLFHSMSVFIDGLESYCIQDVDGKAGFNENFAFLIRCHCQGSQA